MSIRGFIPSDEKDFNKESIIKLKKAANDLLYLIDNGYKIKNASTFIGNHFMFSERQRLALVRSVSANKSIEIRKNKQLKDIEKGITVNVDGFNTIITLEVALSNGTLFQCMDSTIRDLAGLRGTYRLIDKTYIAIELMLKYFENLNIGKAIIYIDAPVSNSGKLKTVIAEKFQGRNFELDIQIINNVDQTLEKLDNVITSDAIILDRCKSWINLNKMIIQELNPRVELISLI